MKSTNIFKKADIGLFFIITFLLSINLVIGQDIGFSKTKNGLYYKFHIKKIIAQKVQIGDVILAELTVRTSDSVLFTNVGNPQRLFKVDFSVYKGDLNEGLLLMGLGESATFIMNADSLKKVMQLPLHIKKNQKVYYDIKIHDIISKAMFDKEQSEMMANQKVIVKEAKENESTDLKKYLATNNIRTNPTETGLFYIEIIEGNGAKTENGNKVSVNYTGKLTDGTLFDTNIEKEAKNAGVYNTQRSYEPISFTLGKGEVIPGWDEGIGMMKVGGKARLVIPSKLGYGERGAGGGAIPPCAILVFEVELVGIEN